MSLYFLSPRRFARRAGVGLFATLAAGAIVPSTALTQTLQASPLPLASPSPRAPLTEIGSIVVTSHPPARHSGTDVNVSAAQLAHAPGGNSLPNILSQLPTAARGSNGQIHLNGDHNGLNYVIDGVQLPASLNQVLGNQIEPADIDSIEVLQGAYPAQYGDRFAAVLQVNTKAQTGPAGADASFEAGSFGTVDTTLGYHTPLAGGGAITIAVRDAQNTRGLDPPTPQFIHNRSSDNSQFVHATMPLNGADTISADILHSNQTFQIPPDTANGLPAITDDDEYQDDTFASLILRHDINGHGSLSFGPSVRVSRILDTNDPQHDLAPGAAPPVPPATSNCTDYADCQFVSVFADRSAHDYRFNADYDLRSAHHDVRGGALYDASFVDKTYQITLQPFSALDLSGAFTATDTAPNVAHQQEAYVQDSWMMGSAYQLDYGLRADAFQIFSSQFDQGFSQVSPRIKLTRIFTPRASVYAYYGRLFEPFSFESVSPQSAASLYVNGTTSGGGYDLRPERDSLYEAGGHVPLDKGELGVRIARRVATDWIDDTQVGATNLHQDINFPRGRVDLQTAYYDHPLPRGGKYYVSATHSLALNSANCETQLLQNCAASGAPGGALVQADHDQRWSMNSGFILNDIRRGWLSIDGEYGSGLSRSDPALCSTGDAQNCKVPPHLIFGAEKGIATGPASSVALAVRNIFNDAYAITLNSSLQGTHYAEPRTIFLRFSYKQ